MLELIQVDFSPFCMVQRRILEFSGVPFKITNIPPGDRSLVWRLTRKRYYSVPILKDGSKVIFETGGDSQVIGKYIDFKFKLGLFPVELEGLQSIVWDRIENEIEEMTFKLNDAYWLENISADQHLTFKRHKERKFGAGCLEQWHRDQQSMVAELTRRLLPFDEMLIGHAFLLGAQPRFIDFDLYGMLGNFLYSGHYRLPAVHARLRQWYRRMDKLKRENTTREKLRP